MAPGPQMTMTNRLNVVREACKLPPDMRTEEDITEIVEFVKDVKFFTTLTMMQQRALCRTMAIETFAAREYVFQKDDVGDKFYIILTGSVSVQIPPACCPNGIHEDRCDCPNKPRETVLFLEKGMGFGELALQSEQPRSASIQTGEATETLVTTRKNYEQYAGQFHRQFIEQRVKFLRTFPRIEDALQRSLVSTQDIAAMANCLSESSHSGNALVVRQGTTVDHIIFVRKGSLAMLRMVDMDAAEKEAKVALSEQSDASPAARSKDTALGNGMDSTADLHEELRRQRAPSLLAANLAKAMLDLKRAERNEKLSEINKQQEKKGTKAWLSVSTAGPAATSQPATPSTKAAAKGPPGRGPAALATRSKTMRFEGGKDKDDTNEAGKQKWQLLKASFGQASLLKRMVAGFSMLGKDEDQKESGEEAALHSIEHFASVSAARRKIAEMSSKKIQQRHQKPKESMLHSATDHPSKDLPVLVQGEALGMNIDLSGGHHMRVSKVRGWDEKARGKLEARRTSSAAQLKLDAEGVRSPRRPLRVMLRIGTIGAFEYFGAKQVCNNELSPVTLVSDPAADIYMMSKYDILRRLPKKLFAALFAPDTDAVPNDTQLLEMLRQTERWAAFRRSMHGQVASAPRALRGPTSRSKVDAAANFAFLGVHPSMVPHLLAPPVHRSVALTAKDEEHFSQSSARFLRGYEFMKRDRDLRRALVRDGHSSGRGAGPNNRTEELHAHDASTFLFEQNWAKCSKLAGLDLSDEIGQDALNNTMLPPEQRSGACRRGSAKQGTSSSFFSPSEPATEGENLSLASLGGRTTRRPGAQWGSATTPRPGSSASARLGFGNLTSSSGFARVTGDRTWGS